MATILTKKKDTTGAPAAGDLTNSAGGAELAVNTADKRLYTKDSGGNVVEVGTNPGAPVTFTAGTAAAPAITTTGDTNTGIFFPAADTIAIAEGGVEVARVNSSGNVGIGTDSPGSKLDVKGTFRLSGSTSGYVGLAPAAAAGSTTYTLPSADGSSGQVLSTNGSGTLSWATVSGGSSQWTTSGSDIYYTTGKVGVGVSTFTSGGGKLQVSDGITFPATQSACSDANTLDDYEEGTWTPSLGGNTTYSGRSGDYTKIGRLVQLYFYIEVNTLGTGSATTISGLPFTASSSATATSSGSTAYQANLATSVVSLAPILPTTTTIRFDGRTAANATATTGITVFGNGTAIYGCITYYV